MPKITLRLTPEEAIALRDRLVPISPLKYDLSTYAILRDLYGRIDRIIMRIYYSDYTRSVKHWKEANKPQE